MLYLVDKPEICGGIASYADKFEAVLKHAFPHYRRSLPSAAYDGDDLIHFELGAKSTGCIQTLWKLSKHSDRRRYLSATIHDCPFLTWGISGHLFPRLEKFRALRKVTDLTIGRIIERRIYENLDTVYTLTTAGRQALENRFGYPKPTIKVIPHVGAAQPYRERPHNDVLPIRLLFFGECRIDKGLDTLLEALSKLTPSQFELTIIGEGPTREPELARYNSRNGRPKVTCLGRIPTEQLSTKISEHDLAIFPYRRNKTIGASGALITVMENGVAALLPEDQTSLLEYAAPNSTITYSPKRLGEALKNCLKSGRAHLTARGLKGRDFIQDRCNPKDVAKAFVVPRKGQNA